MTDISFYALTTHSQQERLDFACKLIEKIFRSGQSCYVLTDSEQHSVSIDMHLWSFRPGSFVPHQIDKGVVPELQQTVLIGSGDIPESRQQLIVNLSDRIPAVSEQTERILEILDNTETCRQAGRLRYRHYQQLGFAIVTHNM